MVCEICEKIKTEQVVYEDDLVVVLLLKEAVAPGHLLVTTKNHLTIEQLDEQQIVQIYYAASFASSIVFELLKLDGTNIIATNYADTHFTINIVPRKKDDDVDFSWTPVTMEANDLDSVLSKIKDRMPTGQVVEAKPKMIDMDTKTETITQETENYLLKQLKRIP